MNTHATIQVNEQCYTLVCGDRFSGRAVYCGPAAYLRIGLPAVIEREMTIHRRLLTLGFPVAPLLQIGIQDGQPFFIEAAIDALFQRYHLPPLSLYLADFRLCRMMQIVQLAERRPLAVQQWIHQQYVTMATAYVTVPS